MEGRETVRAAAADGTGLGGHSWRRRIPDQQIIRPQRRMQGGSVTTQRQGQRLSSYAGRVIEENHQMSHREATTGRLAARLAENMVQLERLGHGEAGAIQEEQAVAQAQPPGRWRKVGGDGGENAALQGLEEGQRQASSRLAVGRRVDGYAAEMAEVATGGVAMQDLLPAEIGGDPRSELALTPLVVGLTAGLTDEGVGDVVGEVILDVAECLGDSKHRWPPVSTGWRSNPILAGGHPLG